MLIKNVQESHFSCLYQHTNFEIPPTHQGTGKIDSAITQILDLLRAVYALASPQYEELYVLYVYVHNVFESVQHSALLKMLQPPWRWWKSAASHPGSSVNRNHIVAIDSHVSSGLAVAVALIRALYLDILCNR